MFLSLIAECLLESNGNEGMGCTSMYPGFTRNGGRKGKKCWAGCCGRFKEAQLAEKKSVAEEKEVPHRK
jgi:hypothetical protein